MATAELQNPESLESVAMNAEADYRGLVAKVADGGNLSADDRGIILMAGRSAGQLRADVERLQSRRRARADLDRGNALAEQEPALAKATNEIVNSTKATAEAAEKEFQEAIAAARVKRDATIGQARAKELEAVGKLRQHQQAVAALRNGKDGLLIQTAALDIAEQLATLSRRREAPASVLYVSRRDPRPLEAEAAAIEQQAKQIDKEVDAYLGAGRIDQHERIRILSPDPRTGPMPNSGGSAASAGYAQWRFFPPKWCHRGERMETAASLFLSQPVESMADRGREAARQLRQQVAEIKGRIAAIEQAKAKAPQATRELAAIDQEIRRLQAEQLNPDRYQLTS